jgi:hypothetical protein
MDIGDKVRVLRGKEEGIVTRIIDHKLIEIEIEDGFQIPVLKSEVVVVAKEEKDYFKEGPSPAPASLAAKPVSPASKTEEGIFVAFRPLNDRVLAVYLINNTDNQIPYTVYQEYPGKLQGLACGNMPAASYHKLAEVSLDNFEQWPAYIFQFLYYTPRSTSLKAPGTKKINFKASSFHRNKRRAPLLDAEAFTFRLLTEASTIDPDKLKENLNENKAAAPAPAPEDIPAVVDLHIENLSPHAASLSSQEMLHIQLDAFDKHLDRAIAAGMDEVVYIHGVGNGTLRNALHKRLSKMENISFFKDAQKNRFGFGATMVKIK